MALNPDEEPHAHDGLPTSNPPTAERPPEAEPSAIPAWMIPAGDVAAAGDRARIDPPPITANGADGGPLPVRPAGSGGVQQAAGEAAPAPAADPSPVETTPVVAVPAVEPLPALDTAAGGATPAPPPRRPWLPGSATPAPSAVQITPPATQPILTSGVVAAAPLAPAAPATPAAAGVAAAAPAGALMLLPGEEVLQQLGALYLTNRRAILYAPTILRAAFLHDIDAVGTLTERSGGWMFLVGLLLLGGGTAAAYNGIIQPGSVWSLGDLQFSPLLVGLPLAAFGIFTLVSYFFWIKRSLFLSVGGRPLIVVSVTGWNAKKLEPVDQFVNTFSAAKDRDRQQG